VSIDRATAPQSLSDWLSYLERIHPWAVDMGLERVARVRDRLGLVSTFPIIAVAGTNGKGSVCAMLESIYRAAGLRVGLFTSPHLVAFGERIQVDRRPIGEADVVRLVGELRGLLAHFPTETHPTFFEVVTVMALRYFAEQNCDLVIWETHGRRAISNDQMFSRAGHSVYAGRELSAWPRTTIRRGEIVFENAGVAEPVSR